MATPGRALATCCVVAGALALVGCGSGTSLLPGHKRVAAVSHRDGPPADPAKVAVVKKWSRALIAGDVRAAAGYFRLPSVFANPPDVLRIHTLAEAELASASLPCGAAFVSAFRQGRFVNVLFRLTDRKGHGGGPGVCNGVGQTARTDFLIEHGLIVEWVRAPSRPGDPGVPTTPTTPTAPSSGGVV